MKIKMFVDKDYCTLAIAHTLKYGDNVSSFKAFKEAVSSYLNLFGGSCVDDHESECGEYMDEAEAITEKYYKS